MGYTPMHILVYASICISPPPSPQFIPLGEAEEYLLVKKLTEAAHM